jgi:hypothetical protein
MSARGSILVALLLGVWFVIAWIAGASGFVAKLTPPQPQILLAILTAAAIAAFAFVPSVRAWSKNVAVRPIVALHVIRLIAGIHFLQLARAGQLAPAFAIPAGWGDIAVGAAAIPLIAFFAPSGRRNVRLYSAWNYVGLADILFVVANAARVALADPASMRALLELPLSLLPTFIVPLVIASHVLLIRRLRDSRIS